MIITHYLQVKSLALENGENNTTNNIPHTVASDMSVTGSSDPSEPDDAK